MRLARVHTAWADADLSKILPHRQDGSYRTRVISKDRLFPALSSTCSFVQSFIYSIFKLFTVLWHVGIT